MYRIYSRKHNAYWTGRHKRPFNRYVMRGYGKQSTAKAQCDRLNDRYPDADCFVAVDTVQDDHYAS